MEISFLQIFIDTLIGVAIVLAIVIFSSRKKEREIEAPNGERYSKLPLLKIIERADTVIYILGDETHQIEIKKEDYDRAIKAYQKRLGHQNENTHDKK